MKKYYIVRCRSDRPLEMLLYVAGDANIQPLFDVMIEEGIPFDKQYNTRYFYVAKKYKDWLVAIFLPYSPSGINLLESRE